MQVSIDTIDPAPGLPKSLKSVLPRLAVLAAQARFRVKIQTVLSEESWARYGEFRALLAPFDFEFGFSLMHDGAGRIAIAAPILRRCWRATSCFRHDVFPSARRGDAARRLQPAWKCLGGYKYLYVNPGGGRSFAARSRARATRSSTSRSPICAPRTRTRAARPGARSAACARCRTRWEVRSRRCGRRSRCWSTSCACAPPRRRQ